MALSRRTLVLVLAGVVVAAAAIAAILILVNRGGGSSSTATQPVASRSTLFAGIRQKGIELGRADAPALVEYADLQCPYCASVSKDALPTVIREYVRTGRVKLVFHGLAFIGSDSTKALRAVESAGLQNRLWDVVDQLYARQGAENSGWVSDDLLKSVGASVAGLDVTRWLDETDSDAVTARMTEAARAATDAGVRGTPTFFFGGQQLQLQSLDAAGFRAALEPLLS